MSPHPTSATPLGEISVVGVLVGPMCGGEGREGERGEGRGGEEGRRKGGEGEREGKGREGEGRGGEGRGGKGGEGGNIFNAFLYIALKTLNNNEKVLFLE